MTKKEKKKMKLVSDLTRCNWQTTEGNVIKATVMTNQHELRVVTDLEQGIRENQNVQMKDLTKEKEERRRQVEEA